VKNRGIFYFRPTDEDQQWGLYGTGAGHGDYGAGEPYPASLHARKYLREQWEKGRVLDEFQLVYIHRGQGTLRYKRGTQEREEEVKAGDLFILFPGVWHTYSPYSQTGWEEYWVGFQGEWAERLFHRDIIGGGEVIIHQLESKWLRSFFEDLIQTLRKMPQNPQKDMRHRIIQLLESLSKRNDEVGHRPHELLLKTVRQNMVKNFRRHQSIEVFFEDGKRFIETPRVSYSTFRSLFKKTFGQSPGQFLDELRFSEAKKLLHLGKKPIKEISEELGFDNPYYFSRFFKKYQGVSPKHFCG
jgi:AraC-like DNA-binding protein